MWHTCLREGQSCGQTKEVRFTAPSILAAHERIVDSLASSLKLQPRSPSSPPVSSGATNALTWLVFPFSVADMDAGDVPGLSSPAVSETVLQRDGVAARLVDRQALDRVLRELKIKSLSGANENVAGAIARLLGADRAVMGTASRETEGFRLDVQVIGVKDAVVVAAGTGRARSIDELAVQSPHLVTEVCRKGISAPAIRPTSADQRRAEADFHLSVGSGQLLLGREMNNVEAAYMLVQADPQFSKRLVDRLCGIVRDGAVYGWGMDLARRAGVIADRILGADPEPSQVPDPLLLRADIQLQLKTYGEALLLAGEHLTRYPGKEEYYAWYIAAEASYGLGRIEDAARYLAMMKKKYTLRQDVPRDWGRIWPVWDLNSRVESRLGVPKTETQAYERILDRLKEGTYRIQGDEWQTYLDLLDRIEGPQRSAEILGYWIRDGNLRRFDEQYVSAGLNSNCAHVDAIVHQARCFLKMERKSEAVRNYKLVPKLYGLEFGGPPPFGKANYEEATGLVARMEAEIGPVDELLKTWGETRRMPREYAACLVPLGDADLAIVGGIAKELGAFFGTDVRVHGAVALPNDAFRDHEGRLDLDRLWPLIAGGSVIPSDAVFVGFITREPIRHPFSPHSGNPVVLSYADRWIRDSPAVVAALKTTMAKRLVLAFDFRPLKAHDSSDDFQPGARVFPFLEAKCGYPCLFSQLVYESVLIMPFAVCPECQERCKTMDFKKIHEDLIDYLRKTGATIAPDGKGSNQ